MVLDKSYRMNTTQEFQILLRKLSSKTKKVLELYWKIGWGAKNSQGNPLYALLACQNYRVSRAQRCLFMAGKTRLATVRYDQLAKASILVRNTTFEQNHILEHFQWNLRWLRLKSLLCCKRQNSLAFWSQAWNQWATKNPLKSNQKSLVILWYQSALMMEARNSSYTDMKITHSKALYAFNMPGWSYCQKSSEYKAFPDVMHSKCVSPHLHSTQQVRHHLRGTRGTRSF